MSEFNKALHDRDTKSGRFSTMTHAEGKPLAPLRGTLAYVDPNYVQKTKDFLLFKASGGRYHGVVDAVIPPHSAAAAKSLRNPRGLADGKIREVALHAHNAPDKPVDVAGPKDGRPLAVSIAGRTPAQDLNVTSGKAIITVRSEGGAAVKVAAGAEAVIVASNFSPVAVHLEEGAKATLMAGSGNNRFTVTGSEEGVTLDFPAPLPPQPEADDNVDDWDQDDTCECGQPNDDGEGWDGKCGDCADREAPKCADCGNLVDDDADGLCEDCAEQGLVAEVSVTNEAGEDVIYNLNRIGDGHYELEDDGDAVVEFHFNGDPEAHGEIQSAGIRALREMGTFVYEEGEVPEKLGGYDVPQRSLQLARELEAALADVPDWKRTETISDWAEAKGYDYSQFDDPRTADNSHGRGAIVVDWEEVGIGTEGHFGRNSWISLDGEGDTFPDGDDYEDGWPGTMSVIYLPEPAAGA